MANGNVITTHGLTKRYGPSITAVDALDLEVHRGEVLLTRAGEDLRCSRGHSGVVRIGECA